jgi:phage-related protein
MYRLWIKNYKKQIINLTGTPNYTIDYITGLTPVAANVNLSESATMDGAYFNSARINTRNIVISLYIEGNIPSNRIFLYQAFPTKQKLTVHFSNENREISINGYVESVDIDLFSQRQIALISILCPMPYFSSGAENEVNFSSTEDMLEFPFDIAVEGIPFSEKSLNATEVIIYNGDAPTGCIAELSFTGAVVNPSLYNETTDQQIKLNFTAQTGDEIKINTLSGQKTITLLRAGVESNIINTITRNSSWFSLIHGDNVFFCTADSLSENMSCRITFFDLFEGV